MLLGRNFLTTRQTVATEPSAKNERVPSMSWPRKALLRVKDPAAFRMMPVCAAGEVALVCFLAKSTDSVMTTARRAANTVMTTALLVLFAAGPDD